MQAQPKPTRRSIPGHSIAAVRAFLKSSLTPRQEERGLTIPPKKRRAIAGRELHIRGFSHHSDFGAVGGAVPDRVNVFRANALRSVVRAPTLMPRL